MKSINLSDIKILIVDRNPLLRTVFRQVLRELGAETVETANNIEDGYAKFQTEKPEMCSPTGAPDATV